MGYQRLHLCDIAVTSETIVLNDISIKCWVVYPFQPTAVSLLCVISIEREFLTRQLAFPDWKVRVPAEGVDAYGVPAGGLLDCLHYDYIDGSASARCRQWSAGRLSQFPVATGPTPDAVVLRTGTTPGTASALYTARRLSFLAYGAGFMKFPNLVCPVINIPSKRGISKQLIDMRIAHCPTVLYICIYVG